MAAAGKANFPAEGATVHSVHSSLAVHSAPACLSSMASSAKYTSLQDEEQGGMHEYRSPSLSLGSSQRYLHNKMRYYSSLEGSRASRGARHGPLSPPEHIMRKYFPLPAYVFGLSDTPEREQSNWHTVLSLVNTMVGSTLVALPWGYYESGLLSGIGITMLVGMVACYTCLLIVRHGMHVDDFMDMVEEYFGPVIGMVAGVMSLLIILGASVAYHIMMQQSLYKVVRGVCIWADVGDDVLNFWTPKWAAVLICLVFPLTNLRRLTALVKVNSWGAAFIAFTIAFVIYHGVHALATGRVAEGAPMGLPGLPESEAGFTLWGKSTFGKLAGMGMLSFFVHNAAHPILRNANPKYHSRNVMTAYAIVATFYAVVGAFGYCGYLDLTYAGKKVADNFLDAFPDTDGFGFVARLSLLLQLLCVFPLLLLIIRIQFFGLARAADPQWPGLAAVASLNLAVLMVTSAFAIFYPNIGDVMRYTGAGGGFFIMFCIPIAMHYKARPGAPNLEVGQRRSPPASPLSERHRRASPLLHVSASRSDGARSSSVGSDSSGSSSSGAAAGSKRSLLGMLFHAALLAFALGVLALQFM